MSKESYMKKMRCLLASLIMTVLLSGCDSSVENRFAAADKFPEQSAKPGLTLSPCTPYEKDGVEYKADCGVLLVPETATIQDHD